MGRWKQIRGFQERGESLQRSLFWGRWKYSIPWLWRWLHHSTFSRTHQVIHLKWVTFTAIKLYLGKADLIFWKRRCFPINLPHWYCKWQKYTERVQWPILQINNVKIQNKIQAYQIQPFMKVWTSRIYSRNKKLFNFRTSISVISHIEARKSHLDRCLKEG